MASTTPDWKETALETIPSLSDEIREAETPYLLWFALHHAFREAYREPRDEARVGQIYRFAKWCLTRPRGDKYQDDIATCVCYCFYQNIPLTKAAWDETPRWLSPEDFFALAEVLRFHSDPDAFEAMATRFRRP